MHRQHLPGTAPPSMLNFTTMDTETGAGDFVDPFYLGTQQMYHVSQADAIMYDHIRSGTSFAALQRVCKSDNLLTLIEDYTAQYGAHCGNSQVPHPSIRSSVSSSARSSNNSNYSEWQARSSMASTNSNSSGAEQLGDQYISETERALGYPSSAPPPYTSCQIEGPTSPLPLPKRRSAQRPATQDRDPFATCVSRPQRPRRSNKEAKYACTACKEPFVEKYDWKRHEETYQERREVFQCSLCNIVYFLDKDFLNHHQKGHRCKTCDQFGHVSLAKKQRATRTGWGCGFCVHFSTEWKERCRHVAHHFERDGKTMNDWYQSNVIYSLLQRPEILLQWNRILRSQQRLNPRFGWNQHSTGRVEGYPESNPTPQLQDLLEYYTPAQNAATLARLAYEQGLIRKKLPSTPAPSQVPEKDYHRHHNASLPSLMEEEDSWIPFTNTIVEDDLMPTGVCDWNFDFSHDAHGIVGSYL
jgi:hypothetical protein